MFIWVLLHLLFFWEPSASAEATTEDYIQWVMTDFPPLILLESTKFEVDIKKAQGPFAEVYQDITAALPQYRHKFVRASFLRAERLFSSHRHYCSLLLQETPERSQFLIFGAEVARALPIGLVMSKSSYEKFKKYQTSQGMDLLKLITEGFRLGVVGGRSYTKDVDKIVKSAKGSFSQVSDKAVGGLFTMLEKDRLDGVLAYYLEQRDFEKTAGEVKFHYVAIKQAPLYIAVRASCEKSPWGERALKDISEVVEGQKVKKKMYQYFLTHLPEEMKKEVHEMYRAPTH